MSNVISSERDDIVLAGSQNTHNNETRRDGNKKSRTKKSPVRDERIPSAAATTATTATAATQTTTQRQEGGKEKVVKEQEESRPVSASRRSKRSQDVQVLHCGRPMQSSCAVESDCKADKAGEQNSMHRKSTRAEKQKAALDGKQSDDQVKYLVLSDGSAALPSLSTTAYYECSGKSGKGNYLDIASIQNRTSETLLIDVQDDDDGDLYLDYSSDDTPFARLSSGDVFAEVAAPSDSRG